jgi:hypothetical protein
MFMRRDQLEEPQLGIVGLFEITKALRRCYISTRGFENGRVALEDEVRMLGIVDLMARQASLRMIKTLGKLSKGAS